MRLQNAFRPAALRRITAASMLALACAACSAAPDSIGTRMTDGTVAAGVSPDTKSSMYTTPADAPGTYGLDKGRAYCETLEAHGHQDWRVPTKAELIVLFQNRAAIGGFNETGSYPAGWYWSSSQIGDSAWDQRFSDGLRVIDIKITSSSLRCVR